MGGTSLDVALVSGGQPGRRNRGDLMGVWTALSLVDVDSIGAGGGSIGWVDARGMLRVGPHSAGADPGPACYGRGGTEPTLTDALLLLGYLSPDRFLGGPLRPVIAGARVRSRPQRAHVQEAPNSGGGGRVQLLLHQLPQAQQPGRAIHVVEVFALDIFDELAHKARHFVIVAATDDGRNGL